MMSKWTEFTSADDIPYGRFLALFEGRSMPVVVHKRRLHDSGRWYTDFVDDHKSKMGVSVRNSLEYYMMFPKRHEIEEAVSES